MIERSQQFESVTLRMQSWENGKSASLETKSPKGRVGSNPADCVNPRWCKGCTGGCRPLRASSILAQGTWEYSEIGIMFVSKTKVFDSSSDIPISSFGVVVKHSGLSSRRHGFKSHKEYEVKYEIIKT